MNCSHTFCQTCINTWKMSKMECPVCRTRITTENRQYIVDNAIAEYYKMMPEDIQQKRNELVRQRQEEAKRQTPPAAAAAAPFVTMAQFQQAQAVNRAQAQVQAQARYLQEIEMQLAAARARGAQRGIDAMLRLKMILDVTHVRFFLFSRCGDCGSNSSSSTPKYCSRGSQRFCVCSWSARPTHCSSPSASCSSCCCSSSGSSAQIRPRKGSCSSRQRRSTYRSTASCS